MLRSHPADQQQSRHRGVRSGGSRARTSMGRGKEWGEGETGRGGENGEERPWGGHKVPAGEGRREGSREKTWSVIFVTSSWHQSLDARLQFL